MAAGAAASVLSGAPSTVHAWLAGRDPLEAAMAAGSMALPHEQRGNVLLIAGTLVHGTVSLGWAMVLVRVLPRRPTVLAGCVAGATIAAIDLGIIGRRFPRVHGLSFWPQVADHVAYGAIVAGVLRRRREKEQRCWTSSESAGPSGAS